MANLLLDATKWQDGYDPGGVRPPVSWNGSVYEFIGDGGAGQTIVSDQASAGDTVSFALDVTAAVLYDPGSPIFTAQINRGGTYLGPFFGSTLVATGITQADSGPLEAGDVVNITYNNQYVNAYNADMVLTPTPDPTPPAPPPPAPCTDLGRVTRCFVNAYNRAYVHQSRVMAQEKRCLVANFNGAMEAARSIVSVVWSVSNPMFINLAQCDITGRETACIFTAQWRGNGLVRCTATTDNGDTYTQYFEISVDGFWFQGDAAQPQGPYQISAP